jgi:hypothetical protein
MGDRDALGDLAPALAGLPAHDVPAARAGRARALCGAALARRRRAARPAAPTGGARRPWLVPLAALGFGLLFVADAVRRAAEAYRWR